MRDSTIIKACFVLFILGLILVSALANSLNSETTAIVKEIHSNTKYLNISVEAKQGPLTITAYQKQPLPIHQGDYILFTGTQKGTIVQAKRISKLQIY